MPSTARGPFLNSLTRSSTSMLALSLGVMDRNIYQRLRLSTVYHCEYYSKHGDRYETAQALPRSRGMGPHPRTVRVAAVAFSRDRRRVRASPRATRGAQVAGP